jgi:hypothetical protein
VIWLLVDVLLGVVVLGGLTAVVLDLWRRVKALGREIGTAGAAIAAATDALADAQNKTPPSA